MHGPPPHTAPTRRSLAIALLPAAAAAAVYAGTLGADFVYDDGAQIVHNPWVTELRHLPKAVMRPVWAFQTTIPTNYFRPLQMGAYNLMWAASGGTPLVFHLANVLLHAAAAGTLALLVRRVSADRLVALGAALLFAVHPLNTEAVSWIACLPEVAYAAFGLAALWLHVEAWGLAPRHRAWARAGSSTAFALALVSKETAVTLLAVVFLLELWIHPAPARSRWSAAARACLPYGILVALYAVARFAAVGGVAPLARSDLTAWDAVVNAPWLLLSYLGKMVWPAALNAYHVFDPIRSAAAPAFLLAAPAVAALCTGVLWLSRRRPDLALAGALTLVPLLPVLYVPAVGLNAFAERYAYLPVAGFTWLVAGSIAATAARIGGDRSRAIAIAALLALAVPAAARTVARARVWHDDEILASTTVRQSPHSRVMWSLLAGTYRTTDRPDRALDVLEQALRQFPGDPLLRAEVVALLIERRRIAPEEAARRLEAIIAEGVANYELHVYLGRAWHLANDPVQAERAFRRAIELNPSSQPAYDGLALALIAQGQTGAEANDLRAGAGFTLGGEYDRLIEGAAHLRAGRLADAERLFEEILRERPDSAAARLSLAVVDARRGDHARAIERCRQALAIQPDLIDAHQQLGISALALGQIDVAVAALEQAAALNPHDKATQNRLGVAYVRAGRTEDARTAWNRALAIDPGYEGARRNLERLDARP